MTIVLDASAAVEVVLNRKRSKHLSGLLSQADSVITPSLFTAEVVNVFWKYYHYDDVPFSDCENYLEAALAIPDEKIDISDMAKETLNAAALTSMTAYDMFYMVLARRYSASLMTLDKKLAATAKKQGIHTC